jgi:hypothetical protein
MCFAASHMGLSSFLGAQPAHSRQLGADPEEVVVSSQSGGLDLVRALLCAGSLLAPLLFLFAEYVHHLWCHTLKQVHRLAHI